MANRRARRPEAAIALAAVVSAAAWLGSTGSPSAGAPHPRPATAALEEGERLYLRDCAVCHGAGGEGTAYGPTLEGVGTASVHFQLVTGRMPISGPSEGLQRPTPPEYTAAEIEAIVAHTRPFVGGGPVIPTLRLEDADVATGGELYRTHCGGCHGTAGAGGALIYSDRAAPGFEDVTPIETAEAMLVGPGTMPVFSPMPLGEREMNEIVAYVDEVLRDPDDRGGFHLWHLGPVPEGAVGWFVGLGAVMLAARWIGSSMKDSTKDSTTGGPGHGVEESGE